MTKPDNDHHIDAILRKILAHKAGMSCDDCYDVVDKYADMLRSGQDPESLLPGVKDHLAGCGDCSDEFKALLVILESSETNAPDKPPV